MERFLIFWSSLSRALYRRTGVCSVCVVLPIQVIIEALENRLVGLVLTRR